MKFSKKTILLLVVALLLVMSMPCALAVEDVSVEAGKSTSLTFAFSDIYNVDGVFAIDDPQNVVSTYSVKITDAGSTAATVSGGRLWASPSAEPVKTTVVVSVNVTVKASAVTGATVTVSFNGIYGDANEAPGNEHELTQSATITVFGGAQPGSNTGSDTDSDPSGNIDLSNGVDYSKLEKQISVATGLNTNDYDDESRIALAYALSVAEAAMESEDQAEISAATEALKETISSLKRMDYSELKGALTRADALLGPNQPAEVWQSLADAAEHGMDLLQSGDQNAVDEATAELIEALAKVADLMESSTETKVVTQEVPVEVLPTDDYCNVTRHHIWPVLFIVSAVLNVALIGLIATYVVRKTRNRRDDTPLVDYDIDDDI